MTQDAAALHADAISLARQGRTAEAERQFAAAEAAPDRAAFLYDHGVALARLGRPAAALDRYDRAIELDPARPEAWNNRGAALLDLGRPTEAQASFEQALTLRPDYAEAASNRGNALLALGQTAAALAAYEAALTLRPTYAKAAQNRARALALLGRDADALAAYAQALALDPANAAALIARGNLLFRLARVAEALASYDAAVAVTPEQAEPHFLRGNALNRLNRPAEAVAAFDRALALHPSYPEAANNRGNALLALDRPQEALDSFAHALRLRPSYAEALNNSSIALRALGRLTDALAAAEAALAIRPAYPEALNNRGNALLSLRRIDAAVASYDRALAIMPDYAGPRFNQALALLLTGDFARGLEAYEARWKTTGMAGSARSFAQPLWQGESDPAGRTILLHAEQGNGDTIQFCRYAPLLAARGARVVLEAQRLLLPLLATLPGVAALVARGEALPEFDLHCPLLGTPRAFATRLETIPGAVPYLAAPPERLAQWAQRVGPRRGPRIGLAWSGSLSHKNDRNRSLPLDRLRPLTAMGLDLHCVQRELRTADVPAFATIGAIAHYGRALADFADTAALLMQMDLVIAVDTAVAHLAGALGRPVWIMLPYSPDWRWLLDRADSPWYPTARLFRQHRPGDWSDVLAEVFAVLADQLTRWPPLAPT